MDPAAEARGDRELAQELGELDASGPVDAGGGDLHVPVSSSRGRCDRGVEARQRGDEPAIGAEHLGRHQRAAGDADGRWWRK